MGQDKSIRKHTINAKKNKKKLNCEMENMNCCLKRNTDVDVDVDIDDDEAHATADDLIFESRRACLRSFCSFLSFLN